MRRSVSRPAAALVAAFLLPAAAFAQTYPGVQGGLVNIPPFDPRGLASLTVCTGSTDASAAIGQAITAGHTNILLPAGCSYTPPTFSGNEIVPAGITITGQNADPNVGSVSLVKTVNRASGTDFLALGPRSALVNVAVQSNWCDVNASPQSTQKLCPLIGIAYNNGDFNQVVTNWAYQYFLFITGPQTTQPGPIVSTDNPLIGISQTGPGDAVFLATTSNGVSNRIQTQGNGDNGLLIQDGLVNPGNPHTGLNCAESGTTNSTSSCALFQRLNGSIAPLVIHKDTGTGTATSDWNQWIVDYQSAGNIRNTFQSTTPFSGIFDLINAGNSGGTFTGQFANYQVAGTSKFIADYQGNIFGAGSLATAPPNTQTGATYSVTTSDGSIIANRAGTVTLTLLNPASFPGRWLTVKTIQAQTVVSASSNVVPLAGGAAGTAILAAAAGKWADLQSDGTNWIIMRAN